MKKENLIRKLLGNDYHLTVSVGINGVEKWLLFRKYNNAHYYFSEMNEAIMTSETNTEEDLLEFAKKHKKYNADLIMGGIRLVTSFFIALLLIVNVILNNPYIRVIGLFMAIYLLIESIVRLIVIEHNSYVETMQFFEDFDRVNKIKKADKDVKG